MGSAEGKLEMEILVLFGECSQEKGTGDCRKKRGAKQECSPTGAMDQMYVCTQSHMLKSSLLKVMVRVVETLRDTSVLRVEPSQMGLVTYTRSSRKILNPFHHVKTQKEGTDYETGSEPSPNHIGPLILDF